MKYNLKTWGIYRYQLVMILQTFLIFIRSLETPTILHVDHLGTKSRDSCILSNGKGHLHLKGGLLPWAAFFLHIQIKLPRFPWGLTFSLTINADTCWDTALFSTKGMGLHIFHITNPTKLDIHTCYYGPANRIHSWRPFQVTWSSKEYQILFIWLKYCCKAQQS